MVFVVKYRKSLINEEIFQFMKKVCKGITERYYLWFEAIGHENNHVHVLIEGAPRYAPSRIMQICKSILARKVFEKFPKIREDELWGGEFWTDGGHIDTVSDGRGLDQVKKYVENQGRNPKELKVLKFNQHTPQLAAE